MPASEYDRWKRWEHQFGPLGPERGDFHAGQISYHLYRAQHGKKFRKKFDDLLIKWGVRRGDSDQPARDSGHGEWDFSGEPEPPDFGEATEPVAEADDGEDQW